MLRVFLADVIPKGTTKHEEIVRMEELTNLVQTVGGIVIVQTTQKRISPDYKTFLGKGKLKEVIEEMKEKNAEVLVIANNILPRQLYAINEELRSINATCWDRVDLILKIFDKHATSTEARLQIELASIKHMGPRIFGMGMEMSRQAGGIGTKGIGETNTEIMRRHLKIRKESIEKKLAEYAKMRKLHREGREKKGLKTVGLVGYTNAGKSSTLKALTNKDAYIDNKLFATLGTQVATLTIFPSSHRQETPHCHCEEAFPNEAIHCCHCEEVFPDEAIHSLLSPWIATPTENMGSQGQRPPRHCEVYPDSSGRPSPTKQSHNKANGHCGELHPDSSVAFTTKQSHDKTNGHCEELHPDSSVAFTTWQSYDKPLEILISDTIGFIADLPPKLIAAFQSTLDDSIHSDLLLHIIDASDPDMEHKIKVVDDILKDLGATQPRILVFNKIDLTAPLPSKGGDRGDKSSTSPSNINIESGILHSSLFPFISISAYTGQNIEQLKELIAEQLQTKGQNI